MGGAAGPSGGATGDGATTTVSRARPVAIVAGLALSFALITLFGTLLLAAPALAGVTAAVARPRRAGPGRPGDAGPQLEQLLDRAFAKILQRNITDKGFGHAERFRLGAGVGRRLRAVWPGPRRDRRRRGNGHDRRRDGAAHRRLRRRRLDPAVGLRPRRQPHLHARPRLPTPPAAGPRVAGVLVIALAVALTFDVTGRSSDASPTTPSRSPNPAGQDHRSAAAGNGSLRTCQEAAFTGVDNGLADCGPAPEFTDISQWIGGGPLTMSQLRGNVVLIDFWAYSCINCQRSLPHVEAWWKRYESSGLRVIGVHTPEYAFEHDAGNVAASAKKQGLTFPLAIDNGYGTWKAYQNVAWPAGYPSTPPASSATSASARATTTARGYLRALPRPPVPASNCPPPASLRDDTPTDKQRTPEAFLGTSKQQMYDGGGDYSPGPRDFSNTGTPALHRYRLAGNWTLADDDLVAGPGATITPSPSARGRPISTSAVPAR